MDTLTVWGREPGPEKQTEIPRRYHEILLEDGGTVILFGLKLIYTISDRIDGTRTAGKANVFNLRMVKVVK